jgi:hypothetical protein
MNSSTSMKASQRCRCRNLWRSNKSAAVETNQHPKLCQFPVGFVSKQEAGPVMYAPQAQPSVTTPLSCSSKTHLCTQSL